MCRDCAVVECFNLKDKIGSFLWAHTLKKVTDF